MHQVPKRGVEGGLGGADIRRFGKIQRQDDGAAGLRELSEPPVLLAGAEEGEPQVELPGEAVSPKRVELVDPIGYDQAVTAGIVSQLLEGIVFLRARQGGVGGVGFPGLCIPGGVVKGLAGERHRAHGRVGVASTASSRRDGEPQVLADFGAQHAHRRILVGGAQKDAGSLQDRAAGSQQAGGDALLAKH